MSVWKSSVMRLPRWTARVSCKSFVVSSLAPLTDESWFLFSFLYESVPYFTRNWTSSISFAWPRGMRIIKLRIYRTSANLEWTVPLFFHSIHTKMTQVLSHLACTPFWPLLSFMNCHLEQLVHQFLTDLTRSLIFEKTEIRSWCK